MEYRNAKYISDTNIDCEIDHPRFGWIPYSIDPADTDKTVDNETILDAMKAAGDVAAYVPPLPTDPATVLAEWRATAKCSRMQGILALGQARWGIVMEYRATATWAEQVVIDDAGVWHRGSENIAFFGYVLGLTDAEMDDLFQAAANIKA